MSKPWEKVRKLLRCDVLLNPGGEATFVDLASSNGQDGLNYNGTRPAFVVVSDSEMPYALIGQANHKEVRSPRRNGGNDE